MATKWTDLKKAKLSPEQEKRVEEWVRARSDEWVEELKADLASARAEIERLNAALDVPCPCIGAAADNARLRALLGELHPPVADLVARYKAGVVMPREVWMPIRFLADLLDRIDAELKEKP